MKKSWSKKSFLTLTPAFMALLATEIVSLAALRAAEDPGDPRVIVKYPGQTLICDVNAYDPDPNQNLSLVIVEGPTYIQITESYPLDPGSLPDGYRSGHYWRVEWPIADWQLGVHSTKLRIVDDSGGKLVVNLSDVEVRANSPPEAEWTDWRESAP